ncbi:MAG: DUF4159 domain-containing protein [bacterium]|nr:DUF4159 domain-containing protein [bacterium]
MTRTVKRMVFGMAVFWILAVFYAQTLWAAPQADRGGSVDSQAVSVAIREAREFLLRNQLNDGGWPEYRNYPLGVTALVTLALINSGLPPEHPDVARALQHLDSQELVQTYSVSLQTMAFCAANPNRYAVKINRNAEWLIRQQLANGGWDYGERGVSTDPSNSQFALLALHEAQRSGVVRFPDRTWNIVFSRSKKYWQDLQYDDGSFPYRGDGSRGSMTCAGIASLVIAGSQTDGRESSAAETITCCGASDEAQDRIEKGLEWLGRNFSVTQNPNFANRYHLYYMYALERVGRLTGRRYIGGHDWYREGAEHLLKLQAVPGGKFESRGLEDGNVFTETAFALLFLSKGKRQTVISRLKYASSDPQDWNHHAVAVQHLTAHTEQAWKRDLSWQNVDIEQSSVQDLLETPVLFISGTQVPRWTDAQKNLLKEYVEQGGFLFVEGCSGNGCDGGAFENYFRDFVVDVFEQPLEKLPPDHPIWFSEARVNPADLPSNAWLYGVQTCCRLGIVYVPYSLSCRWELNAPYGVRGQFPENVQGDLNTATKIGLNVLAYATGKELKEKLDTVTVLEEVVNRAPTERGVFFLPKLRHNAGFDDAPRAIPNLVQWAYQSNPFQLSSEKRIIDITPSSLEQYPLVFMHGRGTLKLSEAQRKALGDYLKNGGFIFADAICADPQFTESFRREMQLITGKELGNLDRSHPMLSRDYYGFDIRTVQVIDADVSGDNIVSATRRISPRLEVGRVDGRVAIVFSPLDLSCALESRHSLQCRGYVREDAARIGINVILFAMQQ